MSARMLKLNDGKPPTDPSKSLLLRLFHLLIDDCASLTIDETTDETTVLVPKRAVLRSFALSIPIHTLLHHAIDTTTTHDHLICLTQPKSLHATILELVGEDGDCSLEEWLDFTLNLKQQHALHQSFQSMALMDIKTPLLPVLKIPPLKSKKEMKKRQQTKLQNIQRREQREQQQREPQQRPATQQQKESKRPLVRGVKTIDPSKPAKTTKKKNKHVRSNNAIANSAPTVEQDLMLWLQDLNLSNRAIVRSASNWRRAFSNGYLFAELLLSHPYRSVYSSKCNVILTAFDPGVSKLSGIEDNWRTLLLLLKRLGIKLRLTDMFVTRVVRAREGAAKTLLEAMYRGLLHKNLVPETDCIQRDGHVSLEVSIGGLATPTAPTRPKVGGGVGGGGGGGASPRALKVRGKPKKKTRSRSKSGGSMFEFIEQVGHVSLPVKIDLALYPVEVYNVEEVAVAIGVLPLS